MHAQAVARPPAPHATAVPTAQTADADAYARPSPYQARAGNANGPSGEPSER
jgi:hypothetical protein